MSTKLAIKQSQLQSWGLVIKDCKESGLTVPEYCEKHNITKNAYYYWYAKVKKELYAKSTFVEIPAEAVTTKPQPKEPAPESRDVIEIKTGNLSIAVPMNASKEILARIIEVAGNAQ